VRSLWPKTGVLAPERSGTERRPRQRVPRAFPRGLASGAWIALLALPVRQRHLPSLAPLCPHLPHLPRLLDSPHLVSCKLASKRACTGSWANVRCARIMRRPKSPFDSSSADRQQPLFGLRRHFPWPAAGRPLLAHATCPAARVIRRNRGARPDRSRIPPVPAEPLRAATRHVLILTCVLIDAPSPSGCHCRTLAHATVLAPEPYSRKRQVRSGRLSCCMT
jgi:hypothetical protein